MSASSRRVEACLRLDEMLFEPTRWFAIDRDNQRVPNVLVATLPAGLQLVGQGTVATIVGRLRDGVMAVDIDLDDWRADWVLEKISAWCRERSLWHLFRPSGGEGRWHAYVITGDQQETLQEAARGWAAELRVSRTQIDVRRALRPLSAPHRRSGATPLPVFGEDSPAQVITAARAALAGSRPRPARRPRPRPERPSRFRALQPQPRPRRDLPPAWADYLAHGVKPLLGGSDHSRSTYEAVCTGMLLRAGHSAESAWTVITNAHPQAMQRARDSYARWIRLWNRAVVDDAQLPTMAPVASPDVLAAAATLRSRLWAYQPGQRGRTSVLRVGLAICERIERTGHLRVPVPERDLLLDTGIRDRHTIRTALRALDTAGLGTLHTDYDPHNKDASSYEFSIPRAGVEQNPPPSSHNPLPFAAHLWHSLPAPARLILTHLQTQPGSTWQEILHGTGMGSPTPGRRAEVDRVLRAAALHGLITVDGDGRWSVRPDAAAAAVVDARPYQAAADTVASERRAWREHASSAWQQARQLALQADARRRRAWWESLDVHERDKRRRAAAAGFSALPPADRVAAKETWAQERARVGGSEADRHAHWIESMAIEEYQRRSRERSHAYHQLAPALRAELARGWRRHRERWSIPRGTRTSVVQLPLSA